MYSNFNGIRDSAERILDETAEAVCKEKETTFIMDCYRKFIVEKKLIADFNAFLFKSSIENPELNYIVQMRSDKMSDYCLPNE